MEKQEKGKRGEKRGETGTDTKGKWKTRRHYPKSSRDTNEERGKSTSNEKGTTGWERRRGIEGRKGRERREGGGKN